MWVPFLLFVLIVDRDACAFAPSRGLLKAGVSRRVSRRVSRAPLAMVVEMPQDVEIQRPVITVGEFFSPPYVDKANVLFTLFGQGLLTIVALGLSELVGLELITPEKLSFDAPAMSYAAAVGALALLLGQIVDRLPGRFWQQMYLETKVFTLRLLGRNTAPLPAAVVAFLTSSSAAISEVPWAFFPFTRLPTPQITSPLRPPPPAVPLFPLETSLYVDIYLHERSSSSAAWCSTSSSARWGPGERWRRRRPSSASATCPCSAAPGQQRCV